MALLGDKGAVIGAAASIRRSGLVFGAGSVVATRAGIGAAVVRLASLLAGPGVSSTVLPAALAVSLLARRVSVGPARYAGGLTIVKALARVSISRAQQGSGPGVSVGEVVQALPWRLAAFPLPDGGYIGRKLAALALARGEAVTVVGNDLTVGGRVVLEASGVTVFVVAGGEARAARVLAVEAGHIGEGVVLAAGPVRDAWLSERRGEAMSYVRKNAKVANKVEDAAKRAALLADLRYMELRA